jgi:hypothetical protein
MAKAKRGRKRKQQFDPDAPIDWERHVPWTVVKSDEYLACENVAPGNAFQSPNYSNQCSVITSYLKLDEEGTDVDIGGADIACGSAANFGFVKPSDDGGDGGVTYSMVTFSKF